MTPLRMNYVAPKAWIWSWLGVAVVVAALSGYFAWKVHALASAASAATAAIDIARAEIEKQRRPILSKPLPRGQSASRVIALLQWDVNKVFSTTENVDVAGTRLTSMTLDLASGNLGLEYALEQSTLAQTVTEALNSGYENKPWQLSRITNDTSRPSNSVSMGNSVLQNKTNVSGYWRITIAWL